MFPFFLAKNAEERFEPEPMVRRFAFAKLSFDVFSLTLKIPDITDIIREK